jgi:hypothetical protein
MLREAVIFGRTIRPRRGTRLRLLSCGSTVASSRLVVV